MTSVHPETALGFEYDAQWGTRIDGSVVKFWGRKSAAKDAARAIGWPLVSVWPVWTRFQRGYAIKQEHEGFLTHRGYEALLTARNPQQEDRCHNRPSSMA